ncbi:hypothetical protein CC2G_001935 [Coprinopsis cinerea AmutBmut pab1-1]|nr:hypothetical protein CC2G_001935 [Coprinopsis cinerea AmutBmut pab1-1]
MKNPEFSIPLRAYKDGKVEGELAGSVNTGLFEHEPEALNHPKLPRTRNSPDPKLPKHDAPKPEALLMGQYKNIAPHTPAIRNVHDEKQ